MRAKDLRDLSSEDLDTRLAETRKELFNIRFQSATGALENTTRLKLARREIARILTVQSEHRQSEHQQSDRQHDRLQQAQIANAKVQG